MSGRADIGRDHSPVSAAENAATYEAVEVPDDLVSRWQTIVDTMAELVGVPAGLIMRLTGSEIEVFVSSRTEENPYEVGAKEHFFDSGLYCETTIRANHLLLVPDALADEEWKDNPDVEFDMISYLGLPIVLPSGTPFGTICVLDDKPNAYSEKYERLLSEFKGLIESQLLLLDLNQQLSRHLEEIQVLRGLIPICAWCKKVRDDAGFWQTVEQYLAAHSDATITHGMCPSCHASERG